MEIRFKVDANDLNTALGVVSVVTPQASAGGGGGGYLFVVQGDQCRVYSKSGGHEARAVFPISEVTGEGAFMYPAEHTGAFAYVTGLISFVATSDKDSFRVRYTHGTSGKSERVSFDPRAMHNFEKDVENARAQVQPKKFSIEILKTALSVAKSFLPKANDSAADDVLKTVRFFGNANPELAKKANGYMYAANGKEACYFYSSAFMDQDLSMPAQHLSLIESFLAKSSGTVDFYPTEKNTYIINAKGDVFGWPRHAGQHEQFTYLGKIDEVLVKISAKSLLYQLQYMRAELSKDKSKIRLHFDPSAKTFWFSSTDEGSTATSLPVEAREAESKVDAELVANVNVNHMIHLFEGVKGDTVEFRVKVVGPSGGRTKTVYMFRTIDEFLLSEDGTIAGGSGVENVPEGVHVCRVTRYAASIE
jgi:hypothetical protein